MAGQSMARRYARAIYELALQHDQPLETWLTDLQSFEQVLDEPGVHDMLVAPKIPFEQKREMLDHAMGQIEPLRRNFAYLLVARGRVDLIGAIAREFRGLVLDHQGIAEARVTTAVPISDEESQKIADHLGRLVGKRVIVERDVDPSIIGGVVARVGDTLINGSIAGQLAAMREQLV